jgi:hypothetical protein
MKWMNYPRTAASLLMIAVLLLTGCDKIPVEENGHYLRFNNATATVADVVGSTRTFAVESDIEWQLTVTPPVPDWMVLDSYSGIGTNTVTITATRNNTTGGYRFAEVIAKPVNSNFLLPVRLTIVQYDSTKGK